MGKNVENIKKALDKKQMMTLIRFGIDTRDASFFRVGRHLKFRDELCNETNNTGCSVIPAFTVDDLLKLLPNEKRGNFTIIQSNKWWKVGYTYSYKGEVVWKVYFKAKKLIDAIYKLIVFLLEEEVLFPKGDKL